jgi:hypothetical protein
VATIAGQLGDAVVLRVDRIDAAGELLVDQRTHGAPVQLLGVARGAEHGDRAWIEQRLQGPALRRRAWRDGRWLDTVGHGGLDHGCCKGALTIAQRR